MMTALFWQFGRIDFKIRSVWKEYFKIIREIRKAMKNFLTGFEQWKSAMALQYNLNKHFLLFYIYNCYGFHNIYGFLVFSWEIILLFNCLFISIFTYRLYWRQPSLQKCWKMCFTKKFFVSNFFGKTKNQYSYIWIANMSFYCGQKYWRENAS